MPIMATAVKWQQEKPPVRLPGQILQRNITTATGAVPARKAGKFLYPEVKPVLHQTKQECIHLQQTAAAVHLRAAAAAAVRAL